MRRRGLFAGLLALPWAAALPARRAVPQTFTGPGALGSVGRVTIEVRGGGGGGPGSITRLDAELPPARSIGIRDAAAARARLAAIEHYPSAEVIPSEIARMAESSSVARSDAELSLNASVTKNTSFVSSAVSTPLVRSVPISTASSVHSTVICSCSGCVGVSDIGFPMAGLDNPMVDAKEAGTPAPASFALSSSSVEFRPGSHARNDGGHGA